MPLKSVTTVLRDRNRKSNEAYAAKETYLHKRGSNKKQLPTKQEVVFSKENTVP